MDDRFFSKMAKPVSEFMILAILKEKGEKHPYEIQQILLEKFSSQKDHTIEMMVLLADISKKAMNYISEGSEKKEEVERSVNLLPDENFREIIIQLIEKAGKETDIFNLLKSLTDEIDIIKDHFIFPGKIWETIGAIYQVMKELQSQGFIEVSKQEIVKGRTRKLYKITDKGVLEAMRMLLIFNSVNSAIYPQFSLFSNSLRQFYAGHNEKFHDLFSKILDKDNSNEFEENNHPVDLFHEINPFSKSQVMFIIQLLSLSEEEPEKILKMFSLEKLSNNNEVLESLVDFREKLDYMITKMKN